MPVWSVFINGLVLQSPQAYSSHVLPLFAVYKGTIIAGMQRIVDLAGF